MHPNGVSRCPVCKEEPLLTQEPYSTEYCPNPHYILACPAHGYIGIGNTLPQVITCWNKLVDHIIKRTALHSVMDPGPLNTSPCFNCERDTEGKVLMEPCRYSVECKSCHMIKFERAYL